MKLWISGEVDSSISDPFRITRNYLEQNINNILASNVYGSGVENWDIIVIISKDKGKEIFKYNKKKKETDIHLVIDINKFKSSNALKQKILLLDALIGSIDKLSTFNIVDFNYASLKKDMLSLKEIIFNQYAN